MYCKQIEKIFALLCTPNVLQPQHMYAEAIVQAALAVGSSVLSVDQVTHAYTHKEPWVLAVRLKMVCCINTQSLRVIVCNLTRENVHKTLAEDY